MNKPNLLSLIVAFLIATGCAQSPNSQTTNKQGMTPEIAESMFQHDADLIRLEHLAYWSGLIEEYHDKTGKYPLQDTAIKLDETLSVRILTKEQRELNNLKPQEGKSSAFYLKTVKELVAEIESGLGRQIDEKYDIQRVQNKGPIGYFYFVSEEGYVLWTPCKTCGVTEISTLLMDGSTPTINIVSEGMVDKVNKSLTREDMLSHRRYKSWTSYPYLKEEYVRDVVRGNHSDSKR